MAKAYKEIANINDLTHDDWLEIRKDYIGGSDAGAICGVNPWASPASVWLQKQEDSKPIQDNERMRIGRDLEDYVAKRFQEATGKKVRRNNFMMVSKEYPFMMANIDREIVGERAILECKTTGSYSKEDWSNGNIPDHYYTQVQHYLAVLGYQTAYIACLIGNESFVWYEVPRDEEYIEAMIEIEGKFYIDNMLGEEMPYPDGTSAYSEALKNRFSQSNGETVDIPELDSILQDYLIAKEETQKAKDKEELLRQQLQYQMGENEQANVNERVITWKTYTRNNFNKKQFEKDYPEIAEKYYTQSDYKRFSVK